jgi:MFS transporter, PPP family, 3-phenylpropionic acid transporter
MKISEANRLRILYFLVFCCTASWLPILADYLKGKGLTGIQIGIILSVTPCMMFLVQPFYGMLADRLGYKKCLLLSSLLASISYAFYLFEGGFAYLFIITVFMALFYNTLQPILDSLSLRLAQSNPKFSYGTLRIAGAAGWAFTGIIAGHYIDKINLSIIFVFAAISMLLAFVFSFSLKPDVEKETSLDSQSFKNVREVFGNRTLIFLLISVFLISAGATTIWNFYSIYMKENGASASLVGFGISFQGLCELPLFYFSAKIIRRFGMKTTLLITVFTTAFRLLLYSAVKNPHAAVFIEVLHGISWSLFWVVCVEYVNMLVRDDWRATGQSLLYAAYYGAGAIVGNFWTGFLYDTKMRISEIFLLNAGIVTGVALFILIFMRNQKLKYVVRSG